MESVHWCIFVAFLVFAVATADYDDDNLTQIDDLHGKLFLPRIQAQFICMNDVREKFNATNTFRNYFQEFLPLKTSSGELELDQQSVRVNQLASGMLDIPPSRWYYPRCDLGSPQVLITVYVRATGTWVPGEGGDNNTTLSTIMDKKLNGEIKELVTSKSVEDYLGGHVCPNITYFRAEVGDMTQTLDHSMYFLCGGAPGSYESDDDDGGFLMLGLLVGLAMVGMILGELQQFENRPSRRPISGRRRGTDYSPAVTSEFEMV